MSHHIDTMQPQHGVPQHGGTGEGDILIVPDFL